MNKLLIVLLAVCLFSIVSAHAFVKRDATYDAQAPLKAFQEQLTQFANDLKKMIAGTANPDTIKQNLNEFVDAAAKTAQSLKPVTDAKPAA